MSGRANAGCPGRLATRAGGFTLVELMIVLVVIAILTATAVPAYQDHVRRARRADAQATLVKAAQFMERNYTEAGRYDQTSGGAAIALPDGLSRSPESSGTAQFYAISLQGMSANAYTLEARPVGGMTGDACGTLTLDHRGTEGVSDASRTAAECWRR